MLFRRSRAEPSAATAAALPMHALLLIVAFTAAVVGQGAYYAGGQRIVAVLVAAAVGSALWTHPWSKADGRLAVPVGCAALAAWAVVSGARAHDLAGAGPTVAMLAALAGVELVGRRIALPERDPLVAAVATIGALVATTGWVGVAWRVTPWASADQGVWRAATTLTYANAAAGLMSPLVLVAVARLVTRPRSPLAALVVCLLLVGLGATLSRGGAVALVAGAAVLAGLLGLRPVLRAAAPPVVGAVVALAGLVPSMPASGPARPALAVVALTVGLAMAAGLSRLSARALVAVLAITVIMAALALVPGSRIAEAIRAVGRPRLSVVSSDRVDAARAALRLVAKHPVTGVGPGQATFVWTTPDGRTMIARYAHNEYLQVLVELGLVGLVLLLILLVAIARTAWRGRAAAPSLEVWAGAVAGLVALGAHSALDFLWHIPAISLTGALLVGMTTPENAAGAAMTARTPSPMSPANRTIQPPSS